MARPLPFIVKDASGRYTVGDDAAKLLSGITGSVAVIAVAGVQHAADG